MHLLSFVNQRIQRVLVLLEMHFPPDSKHWWIVAYYALRLDPEVSYYLARCG